MADITIPGTNIKLPPWAVLVGVGGIAAAFFIKGAPPPEENEADYTGLILSETDQRLRELTLYIQQLLGIESDFTQSPSSSVNVVTKVGIVGKTPQLPNMIKCFKEPCPPGAVYEPLPDKDEGKIFLGPPVPGETAAKGGRIFGGLDFGPGNDDISLPNVGIKAFNTRIPGKPCTSCLPNITLFEPPRITF